MIMDVIKILTRTAWISLLAVVLAAPPALGAQWAKAYGGVEDDWANDVFPAPGGGFIVAGGTTSYLANANVTKAFWIIKLDAEGSVLWQKADVQPYSNASGSDALAVRTAKDGRTAVLVNYFYPGCNYFQILKFDRNGKEAPGFFQYYRTEFVPNDASVYPSFAVLGDGGFLVAGHQVGPSNRTGGMALHRLNKRGWSQAVIRPDGPARDYAHATAPTPDGGALVAGVTESFGAGGSDAWVLKVSPKGRIQRQFAYGGPGEDIVYDIERTPDGGAVILGQTDGEGLRRWDLWVLKLDRNGAPEWEKTYGGTNGDYAHSIQPTRDGGYIAAGTTYSFNSPAGDAWVLKLDAEGEILWQYRYGRGLYEGAWAVREIPAAFGGGYIVAGRTQSYGAGNSDALVMKLAEDGTIDPSCGIFFNATASEAKTIHSVMTPTDVQPGGHPIGAFFNRFKAGDNGPTAQTVICRK